MKKLLFLAALLMAAAGVRAQSPQIYNDTIGGTDGRVRHYFYNWWYGDTNNSECHVASQAVPLNVYSGGACLNYYYTDEPLNITGLAVIIDDPHRDTNGNFIDTTWREESLLLYDAHQDSFALKARVPWNYRDGIRYVRVPSSMYSYEDGWYDTLLLLKTREYYFEKDITVEDSFYLGATFHSNVVYWDGQGNDIGLVSYWGLSRNGNEPISWHLKTNSEADSQWVDIDGGYNLMVFPIIKVSGWTPADEDTCGVVYGLTLESSNGDFWWQTNGTTAPWQVEWAREGEDFDADHRRECNIAYTNLADVLQHGVNYSIRVRAYCPFDTVEHYGPWTQLDGCQMVGIADVPEGIRLALHPNPARENCLVECDRVMRQVEVVDMSGRIVMTLSPETLSVRLDVSGLSRGLYFVRVTCDETVCSRRMMVE